MTSEKPTQSETMRRHRDGLARRLDRIERGIGDVREVLTLLLAVRASETLNGTRETRDATDR